MTQWLRLLYAPWRFTYIKSISEKKDHTCIFCEAPKRDDDESLILARGTYSYVIMNLYPYNTGHVMVVPYRHVPSLEDLDESEAAEIFRFIKISMKALREAMNPHGFNIGVNVGRVAGAGIDKHVHVHIVPRWNGDANFMPVIGGVKVISQDVRETYRLLKPIYKKYLEEQG